jgi:hypothetical protein
VSIKNNNTSKLTLWIRLCVIGIFYVFIHFTIILPVLQYQQFEISIVENTGDKETENEVEDDLDHPFQNLLAPLLPTKRFIHFNELNLIRELHITLHSPPPEHV